MPKPPPLTPGEQEARARVAAREQRLAARPAQLPGTWEASVGKGAVQSHMILELRPDQTFTLTNSIAGGPGPEPDVTNVSEGHWRVQRGDLMLSLERSADGRPIPAEKKEARFMVFQDEEGSQVRKLALVPHGPEFTRRAGATSQP